MITPGGTAIRRIHERRLAFATALVTFTICATCIFALSKGGSNLFDTSRETELKTIAKTAAAVIDGDLHKKVRMAGKSEGADYQTAVGVLARIQEANPQINYIYTCIKKDGKVHFVLDPTEPGDADKDGVDDKSYVMDAYDDYTPEMMTALETSQAVAESKPTKDDWGTFISAYAPFFTSQGKFEGIVGVDLAFSANQARQQRYSTLVGLAVALSLAFSCLAYSFAFRYAKKLRLNQDQLGAVNEELEAANQSLERRVEERTGELRLAVKAKDVFLTNMSHEMRTPLNGIIGMNHLLRDTPLTEHQIEFLDASLHSAEHLLELVSDILTAAQLRQVDIMAETVPTLINHEVALACEPLRMQAKGIGVNLVMDFDATLDVEHVCDPLRLRQIVANLVGNAVKFTEPGGAVVISTSCTGPTWTLEVADTGIGIAKDKLPIIFEEFSQVDSSSTRRYGGTGLGLAITKRLVALLDGEIHVESILGQGTTFRVTLPRRLADASAAA